MLSIRTCRCGLGTIYICLNLIESFASPTDWSAMRWPWSRYSVMISLSEAVVRRRRPTTLMPPRPSGTHPPVLSSRVITCALTRTTQSSLNEHITLHSTPLLWLGSNMHQSFSVCGTGNWTSCRQSTRACYRCKPSTSWFLCKTCNFSYQEINLEPFLGMSWHRQTVLKLRLKWMNKVCVHIHWAAADTSPLQVVK